MPRNQQEQTEETVEKVQKPPKNQPLEFIPYTGPEDLPKFTVLDKGDAKAGRLPRVALAPPRFACARGERDTVKVITFQRHPRGVVRKLFATLKLKKSRPKDLATYAKLKAARVPGAL